MIPTEATAKKHLLILCRDYHVAEDYARHAGLGKKEWTAVQDVPKSEGWDRTTTRAVVVIGYENGHIEEAARNLRRRGIETPRVRER